METSMLVNMQEISEDVLEILYKGSACKLSDGKKAKAINSQLNNSSTRKLGLIELARFLPRCSEDELAQNVVNWMNVLTQIIIQNHQDLSYRELSAKTFSNVLKYSRQVPEASRELSSHRIAMILQNLLLTVQGNKIPVLVVIDSILTCYPASCGSLRSRIVKYLLPIMMMPLKKQRSLAIRCWSKIPFLGGGGTNRIQHSKQWTGQVNDTLAALHYAFSNFSQGELQDNTTDPSIGSLSLPLPELERNEPQLSFTIVQRLCYLSEGIISLLDVEFPNAVVIPMDEIISFVLNVLNITPGFMGNTSEMLIRNSCLSKIHTSVLKMLSKLMRICKRQMCRYNTVLNRKFSTMLDVWNDPSPVQGRQRRNLEIKSQIYSTMETWLQMCGATCKFLCGPSYQTSNVLRHLMGDISPAKETLQISNSSDQEMTGAGGRAKKRKLSNISMLHNASNSKIDDEVANSRLRSGALKVLSASVAVMSIRLSPTILQTFQKTIVTLLLQIQQRSEEVQTYIRCSSNRLELYQVLLALTLSPTPACAPPVSLSMKIFNTAGATEPDVQIKKFCMDALISIGNVIQPWRVPWQSSILKNSQETSDSSKVTTTNICPKCSESNRSKNTNVKSSADQVVDLTLDSDEMEINIPAQNSMNGEISTQEIRADITVEPENISTTLGDDSGVADNSFDTPGSHANSQQDRESIFKVCNHIIDEFEENPQQSETNPSFDNGAVIMIDDTISEVEDLGLNRKSGEGKAEHQTETKEDGLSLEVKKMLLDFVESSPDKDD